MCKGDVYVVLCFYNSWLQNILCVYVICKVRDTHDLCWDDQLSMYKKLSCGMFDMVHSKIVHQHTSFYLPFISLLEHFNDNIYNEKVEPSVQNFDPFFGYNYLSMDNIETNFQRKYCVLGLYASFLNSEGKVTLSLKLYYLTVRSTPHGFICLHNKISTVFF